MTFFFIFSAHCVHLAVQDLLYKESDRRTTPINEEDEDEEDDPIEDSDQTSLLFNIDVVDEILPDLSIYFAPAVESCKQCLKFYRCSAINKEILQSTMDSYHKSHGLPLKLISLVMDCKTRWNSLPYMIRSLFEVKPGLLILKNLGHTPTAAQFDILEALMAALMPVEILTTMLCGEQVTVLDAESYFLSTFSELEKLQTSIADKMLEILKRRYASRRNKELVSVMQFLSTPLAYNHVANDLLPLDKVRDNIKEAYKKLFPEEERVEEAATQPVEANEGPSDRERNASEQERMAKRFKMDQLNRTMEGTTKDSSTFTLDDEITVLANSGDLRPRLKLLLQALKSIPATSTDCERAFSVASNLLTRVRNKLEDETLDALSFAKAYLNRN